MSRYNIPAQNPALTVIVGWDNPLLDTFFAQVFDPVGRGRSRGRPPVDRHRTPGDPHRGGAPGPAHRLGHHPARHRGLPHARSTGRHAAYPAAALGTAAPVRRRGRPAQAVPNPRQREATRSPLATAITLRPLEVSTMATIHDMTAYRKAAAAVLRHSTATCPASPPGWLEATRSAPTPPRPPAWSAPPTRRWSCSGGATWQTLPVRPTRLLGGSLPASAALKPGAAKAPIGTHHTLQTGERPCPVSTHHPMLTPHDDTVIAWQQACAQAADALRPQHDRERLAKALAMAHEGAVTLGDDEAALVTSHGTQYRIDADGLCHCPDAHHRGLPCKHLIALQIHRQATAALTTSTPSATPPATAQAAPPPARTAGPSRRPRPVVACDCI